MNNDILAIYVEQFPNKEMREFHFGVSEAHVTVMERPEWMDKPMRDDSVDC